MTLLATTTVNVHRPTISAEPDAHGDDVETLALLTPAPVAFSLIEKRRRIFDPSTGETHTVRYFSGRCSPSVDVRTGDRITDLSTGLVFAVDENTLPTRGLAGYATLSLELRLLGDRIVP